MRNGVFKSVDQVTDGVDDRAEVWIRVHTYAGEMYTISSIYQEWMGGRVAGRDNEGLTNMASLMADKNTIMLGDFNTDAESDTHPEYLQNILLLGYQIKHAGPTHTHIDRNGVRGEKALDFVVTNIKEVSEVEKSDEGIGDHEYIEVRLNLNLDKPPEWCKKRDKKKLYARDSVAKLAGKMQSLDERKDTEEYANDLVKNITSHMDELAPEKPVPKAKRTNPGLPLGAKGAKRAYQRAKRNGNQKIYERYLAKYYKLIREDRIKRVEYDIRKYGADAMWKFRKTKMKAPEQAIAVRDDNGTLLTDSEAADAFMEKFVDKVRKARPPDDNTDRGDKLDDSDLAIPPQYRDNQVEEERRRQLLEERHPELRGRERLELRGDYTEEEVKRMVESMKASQSTDMEGMTQTDLKELSAGMLPQLTLLINKSLEEGIYPDALKTARIKPLPKAGKDRKKLSSYRPISLLPPCGKLIELAVKKKIIKFIEDNGILPRTQHGYRKGRGCATAVAEAMKEVDVQRNKGRKTGLVLYDFSCAFDLVEAEKLILEAEKLGFAPSVLRWIRSYLRERKAFVEVNGKRSEVVTLETGTPQGSIISPLLFVILIARMGENFEGLLIGYADDSTNVLAADTTSELKKKMEESMKKMKEYATKMGMALNLEKTEYIYFGRTKMDPIHLDGVTLEESRSVRFLGIRLNKNLNGADQIKYLAMKAASEIRYIRKLCLPFEARRKIAVMTIWPKITSELATWTDPTREGNDRTLMKVQIIWNNVCRATIGWRKTRGWSVEELMNKMKSRHIRDEALYKLGQFLRSLRAEDSDVGYLIEFEEDANKSKRPRRNNKLFTLQAGVSSVNKARRLQNLFRVMGKENIIHEDKEDFESSLSDLIPELRDKIYRTSHGIA